MVWWWQGGWLGFMTKITLEISRESPRFLKLQTFLILSMSFRSRFLRLAQRAEIGVITYFSHIAYKLLTHPKGPQKNDPTCEGRLTRRLNEKVKFAK